jgi:hypothetical protein
MNDMIQGGLRTSIGVRNSDVDLFGYFILPIPNSSRLIKTNLLTPQYFQ